MIGIFLTAGVGVAALLAGGVLGACLMRKKLQKRPRTFRYRRLPAPRPPQHREDMGEAFLTLLQD